MVIDEFDEAGAGGGVTGRSGFGTEFDDEAGIG